MPSAALFILSAGAIGILLFIPVAIKYTSVKIVNLALQLHFPIKNDDRKRIRGPFFESINGQTLEKFLNGRAKAQEWQQYGPVYRLWAGVHPEVVISNPEDVKAFFTDSHLHNKARSSNAGWMFQQLLGDCMGLINGTRWTKVRREFAPAFTHPIVKMNKEQISQEAEEFIEEWGVLYSPSFTAEAASAVSRFPFFCTATQLYGKLDKDEKDLLWQLGQQSLGLMRHVLSGGLFRFPIARILYPQATRELDCFMEDWFAFNQRMYRSRRGMNPQPLIVSVWQQLLDGEITREELLQTLSEILFANLDVSTGNLSWLVIYLASNVKVQQDVFQEMQEYGYNMEEFCTKKGTLLAHCLLETLRLRPFTVFSIPDSSPTWKTLGGYAVPPNTSVVVNTLAVNYNQSFWGKDSEVFSPTRFKSIKQTELRYNLFTFGFGSRKCLGSHLAELMMKLFIVQLLKSYSLSLPTDSPVDLDSTSKDTWVPISDKKVVFERRQSVPQIVIEE